MHRERVSDNVFWFQSEVYAQVTAGVVAGPQWAVLIDTLALPDETLSIREFVEHELNVPIRYVINTHYHADHAWGNCFFPGATIISHAHCRDLLEEMGTLSLEAAQKHNPALRQVKIVLPQMTFVDGDMTLRVGKKNLVISSSFGHSNDGISVLVEEDRILFAGDAFMPVPHIVDGDIDDNIATIKNIGKMGLENIVQGHGDIILRGEIEAAVKDNISYLMAIKKKVKAISRRKNAEEWLDEIIIEDCGKSRVLLGGLARALHQSNLNSLLYKMTQ
ncbi:MAG TPA: MBL fold metallo-hydrolase [Anaerolineales bacterium]|nr:MBL fold metallo-hydrolase [Anaerolineales bacterium]